MSMKIVVANCLMKCPKCSKDVVPTFRQSTSNLYVHTYGTINVFRKRRWSLEGVRGLQGNPHVLVRR